MSSSIHYSSEVYCAACDQYFISNEARAEHIDRSSNHPHCDTCDRRFLNMNTLRNHYVISHRHYYCVACDKSFETASALHRHTGGEGDDNSDEEEMPERWEDDLERRESLYGWQGGDEGDQSWEDYDECDFEDEEELGDLEDSSDDEDDLVFAANSDVSDSSSQHSSESANSSIIIRIPNFTCPLCKATEPVSICSTPCGHMFCTPCILKVYNETGACPVKVCREAGKVAQLRKIYLSGA